MLSKHHRFPETLPVITKKNTINSTASAPCPLSCFEMRTRGKWPIYAKVHQCKETLPYAFPVLSLHRSPLNIFCQFSPPFFLLPVHLNTDQQLLPCPAATELQCSTEHKYFGFSQKLIYACKSKRMYELSTDSSPSPNPKALIKANTTNPALTTPVKKII